MQITQQLANRFREVILNGKWVAYTNIKEQIDDVNLELAVKKYADLNSIALLTFHLNYYLDGVLNVFDGGELEIRDKFSFDMPPLNDQQDWLDLKNRLFTNAERFAQYVEKMADEDLTNFFVDPKFGTYLRNIEGMIDHCNYHFGQIVIIKKLLISTK